MIFSNTKLKKYANEKGIVIKDCGKISRFRADQLICASDSSLMSYSIEIPWSATTPVSKYSLPRITKGDGVSLIYNTEYDQKQQ